MTDQPALRCEDLTVAYTDTPVLRGISLEVARGEVVALLGPSGSGKTTLLYAVAGFVPPRGGRILLGGEPVAAAGWSRPPEARRVGVVFQNYALWPHLTALETVAYPLRRRGVADDEARRQAGALLERMGLEALSGRRPAELSGGQQQRIGLARALARRADLYLFDEPTAHLDTMLKRRLEREMAERRREQGAAALHATHDAGEALAVADRVLLLRDGRVIQRGAPREVFQRPVDVWAARLTGAASLLQLPVVRAGGGPALVVGEQTLPPPTGVGIPPGAQAVSVVVRPGWAGLGGPLPGTVRRVWYRGAHTDHAVGTPVGEVVIRHAGPPRARDGDRVGWHLDRGWRVRPDPPAPPEGG